MTQCTEITHCLACGSDELTFQLDLGTQALANNYIDSLQVDEPKFPLAINRCNHCNHLQLTHAVDPAIIYKHYLYVSGTSQTGRDHFEWFARFAREYFDKPPVKVLDIGCNDGTQLDFFKSHGMVTYGIDPAENLFPISCVNHNVYCGFFNDETTDKLVEDGLRPDIIVAQNSFAHNPDPLGYLKNISKIMKHRSLFFVQTSQAEMIVNNEFDTIYHEHINFFNINSMNELCKRAGLVLVDVVKAPIHGTSYIFVIGNHGDSPARIENLINIEKAQGLLSADRYVEWADSVRNLVEELVGRIEAYSVGHGYKVIGYGAAAKGNTLLQFSGLRPDAIIDDNPRKQGLLTPGTNIPIVSIDYLDQFGEDDKLLFVPLAWNFYDEIRERIKDKRDNSGDRFARYFPEVEIEQ